MRNKHIKDFYSYHLNEARKIPYETNYTSMVNGAIANLYNQIMAIAQQIANEKLADRTPGATGEIKDIDISKAMNLIFHSDWKKKMKKKLLSEIQRSSMERAKKQDELSNKKNLKALAKLRKGDTRIDIDKSDVRFSDKREGKGPGSNQ